MTVLFLQKGRYDDLLEVSDTFIKWIMSAVGNTVLMSGRNGLGVTAIDVKTQSPTD